MKEEPTIRNRYIFKKGYTEWIDGEFETHPQKSYDTIPRTAIAVWKELNLDDDKINSKPNGEPIFYLNDSDPNRDIEIGPNKRIRDVAWSLEGQIEAARGRRNIKDKPKPHEDSKNRSSHGVNHRVELESTVLHIQYMFFEKYVQEGCPEKNGSGRIPPIWRNKKGSLCNWPQGYTSDLIEQEEKKRAKEKEKAARKEALRLWKLNRVDENGEVKEMKDGTEAGFKLCHKEYGLEVMRDFVFKVRQDINLARWHKDSGFVERCVFERIILNDIDSDLFNKIRNILPKSVLKERGERLNRKQPEQEVKPATKEDILGKAAIPEDLEDKVKTIFRKDKGKEIVIKKLVFRQSEKLMGNIHCLINAKSCYRSTGTKDKKEARVILNKAKKMFKNSQMKMQPSVTVLEPAQEPAQAKSEPKETMRTTEKKPTFFQRLFGHKSEPVKVVEELEETVWIEPDAPEPMKESKYLVKDALGELVKAKGRIIEITATIEERAKAKAFDAMGQTLVLKGVEEKKARLAKIKLEAEKLRKELGEDE